MAILTYEDTHEPGHYIFEGGGRRVARAVNVDTRESDLRPIDRDALEQKHGVHVAGPDDIARQVREARHGKEIYKLIVALVLVLLTLELFLSRGNSSQTEPA